MALCHPCFFFFFFFKKTFLKDVGPQDEINELNDLSLWSLFFHNVGNLNKQKLIKEVQGIHVVACV